MWLLNGKTLKIISDLDAIIYTLEVPFSGNGNATTQRYSPYLSVFSSNAGKYGPEKTPYLNTFHAVIV